MKKPAASLEKTPVAAKKKRKTVATAMKELSHEEMVTEAIKHCSPDPHDPAGPPCKIIRMHQRYTTIF